MPIPETTSVEGFERHVGGKCLRMCHGEVWRDTKSWSGALPGAVAFAISQPEGVDIIEILFRPVRQELTKPSN